jgi:hypothetical protein
MRGRLTLVDVDSGALHQFDVYGEVEAGWLPPHDGWEHFELLGRPVFTSDWEMVLQPEFGPACRFTVPR